MEKEKSVLDSCKFKVLSLNHNLGFNTEQFSREGQKNLGLWFKFLRLYFIIVIFKATYNMKYLEDYFIANLATSFSTHICISVFDYTGISRPSKIYSGNL